jgi:hypothetical protein
LASFFYKSGLSWMGAGYTYVIVENLGKGGLKLGYILPIPHFQYTHYRERVANENAGRSFGVEPVESSSFKKILDNNFAPNEQSEEPEEMGFSRQKQQEAFQAHLAKISGKGLLINKLT